MNLLTRRLSHVYRVMPLLYPAAFRDELAAEMKEVLSQVMADAARLGLGPWARLCLRELGAWPGAAIREGVIS